MDHDFELIHAAANYSRAAHHADALANANAIASRQGGLIALIRIWTMLDGEVEGLIRRETVNLVQGFRRE